MPQATAERVPRHTRPSINEKIAERTMERVRYFAAKPGEIAQRLRELDREWDTERVLETNASVLAFVGVLLGAFVHQLWLLLPALVTAFLFQHAVQGWCPPLPILRRLGVRTAREIETERIALKRIRGDFGPVSGDPDTVAQTSLAAARA